MKAFELIGTVEVRLHRDEEGLYYTGHCLLLKCTSGDGYFLSSASAMLWANNHVHELVEED
jgi:hypothetical protein